ncbi:hypothetical protein XELAEV_18032863mg [Xenopus laevis]|uniref:Uncharacterized protein n=1 Tax=Xenopus laevis TaxID=8355 RepID=A0A974CIB4_XENLA|nr:hypothetical protein XELAEV_18032863mg [Xenopus laevis]
MLLPQMSLELGNRPHGPSLPPIGKRIPTHKELRVFYSASEEETSCQPKRSSCLCVLLSVPDPLSSVPQCLLFVQMSQWATSVQSKQLDPHPGLSSQKAPDTAILFLRRLSCITCRCPVLSGADAPLI